jgi:integrase/recombinase XerD
MAGRTWHHARSRSAGSASQGGRRGRPWSPEHARKRKQNLRFWKEKLKLPTQHDLLSCQVKVERVIYQLHIEKRLSGKTCWNRAESLTAFCRWCIERDYLDRDPLRRLKRPNTDPVQQRRPLSPEEIPLLLDKCLPERRLLYETAICTGLRANELRNITPLHLETERGSIRLEAAWTKNRLDGFQPVPDWLMVKLTTEASDMAPEQPLFLVQKTHPARMIQADLERAGIPLIKPGEGKIVFHSLRMTYCSLLDYSGASAKENQELARHSTPTLTMQRYVRTRVDSVRGVVEALGKAVNPPLASPQYPHSNTGEYVPLPKVV